MTQSSTNENTKEIALFCFLAMALGWLITIPLWISGNGLRTTGASLLVILYMWSPALTALGLFFVARRNSTMRFSDYFEIRLGTKWLSHSVFHIFSWPIFAIATPFVASALGLFELDSTFSGFEAMVRDQVSKLGDTVPDPFEAISVKTLVAIQLAMSFTGALINLPVVLGEELGWRAFLLPRLRHLGFWKANVLLCLIWSFWHTPLLLLGHNYPNTPVQGLLFMAGFCMVIGTLINWSSWQSRSVWPAALGHGAINGSAAAIVLFQAEGASFDPRWAGMTGISGWILPILLIAFLWVRGHFNTIKTD